MNYKIGLDIGITSVGWATVRLNNDNEPDKIIDLGVRIFDAAENPKDGASLSMPRRIARGSRRRLRRHRHRLERVRMLIKQYNILSPTQLDHLYENKGLEDIYAIRVRALDERLDNSEWARLLIHLAQRRGFKSNRKTIKGENEEGKLINAVENNKKILNDKGYRTVGEMLLLDEKFKDHKRNKGDDYSNTVEREMILDEVKKIFNAQRENGNTYASNQIEEKYIEIVFSQRSFDMGPGEPSKYSGNQIEKMIGTCTFERSEKRAPKASYSAEYANLLQNINNMKISTYGKKPRFISNEERDKLIDLAKKVKELKYSRIRKELKLKDDELFANLNYGEKDRETVEKKSKFTYLNAYHSIKTSLKKIDVNIEDIPVNVLNAIGYAFTVYKTDDKIIEYLKDYNLSESQIDVLVNNITSFSKFSHLSIKALNKLIPYLEQGYKYHEACEKAGYNFKAHDQSKRKFLLEADIEELKEITNPVVRRAVSQTRKVVNAIIRKYNESPTFITVELARELAKDHDERERIRKSLKENYEINEEVRSEIHELGIISPTGQDIVKYKLWKSQDCKCAYSLKPIPIEKLFETGYCDVDHIIPYSKCFDDSYANKVVVLASENRQKGNRLPLQYLDEDKKDKFKVWVNTTIKNKKKRDNLLKEELTEEDINSFKSRNLNDTKYISRFMLNYLNDYLLFNEAVKGKKRVIAVNGTITSFLRKRWGLSKIREDGDLHHAIDAVVVACTTDKMIQNVSKYYDYRERRYVVQEQNVIDKNTGEIIEKFPVPWKDFRKEVEIRLMNDPMNFISELPSYKGIEVKPVMVSRAPKRKVRGAAHKDTMYSPKLKDEGLLILKRDLKSLKLDKKSGEIKDYYNPQSDRLLYEYLKAKLHEYDGNAAKAFAEPVFKPTKTGEKGPRVKKVKVVERSTHNVTLNSGKSVANNGDMVRIDVFYVEGEGYYYVPIYVADTVKEKLPNKAVVQHKSYEEWRVMDDKDFIFSLYPNDLIKVTSRVNRKTGRGGIKFTVTNKDSTLEEKIVKESSLIYYTGADISTASITAINHDNSYKARGIGIKTLISIEKYNIDVLGNYNKIRKEKRMPFK